jgi:hypothetical protein
MKPQPCGATAVPGSRAVGVGNFVEANSKLEAFRLGALGTRSGAVRSPKHEIAPQAVSGRIERGLLSSCNKTFASGFRTHQCLESRERARCKTGAASKVVTSAVVDAVIAGVQGALEPQTQARAPGLPSGLTRVEGELGRVAHEQRRGRYSMSWREGTFGPSPLAGPFMRLPNGRVADCAARLLWGVDDVQATR